MDILKHLCEFGQGGHLPTFFLNKNKLEVGMNKRGRYESLLSFSLRRKLHKAELLM